MRRIGKSGSVTALNGLGHNSTCTHTDWQVEPQDVGQTRDNYLGFRHRTYMFTRQDVGKVIDVMTDGSSWTCWSFGSHWGTVPPMLPETPTAASLPEQPKFQRQIIPVISTGHISEDADKWLHDWGGQGYGAIIVAAYEGGWFIKVLLDHDNVSFIPQPVREVAEWAKARGYEWFRLDRDGSMVDGLTRYNW